MLLVQGFLRSTPKLSVCSSFPSLYWCSQKSLNHSELFKIKQKLRTVKHPKTSLLNQQTLMWEPIGNESTKSSTFLCPREQCFCLIFLCHSVLPRLILCPRQHSRTQKNGDIFMWCLYHSTLNINAFHLGFNAKQNAFRLFLDGAKASGWREKGGRKKMSQEAQPNFLKPYAVNNKSAPRVCSLERPLERENMLSLKNSLLAGNFIPPPSRWTNSTQSSLFLHTFIFCLKRV